MTVPRLTLTGSLILALLALPHAVEAQQARIYRGGVCSSEARTPRPSTGCGTA